MKLKGANSPISSSQLLFLTFGTIVGVGFITMPRGVIEKAREDAWITILLATLIALGALWLILQAARKFPDEMAFQYNLTVFGRPLGFLFNLGISVYFLFFTVTGVRTMAEVVRAEMLPFTPLEVIVIAMILLLVYSSWDGLTPIARLLESGLPLSFCLIILFLILAFPEADWSELRYPFLSGVKPVLEPLPTTVYSFLGFEILYLFYPFLLKKNQAFFAASIGVGLAGIFYLFLMIGTLVILGPDVTIAQTFPVITMAKTVEVVRQFVERAELLLIVLWLPLAYTTHVVTFFSTAFSFHHTIPRVPFRWWIVLQSPLIYLLALTPPNLQQMDVWSKWVGNAGIFLLIVYPLLLLLVAYLRGLGRAQKTRKA